MFKKKKYYHPIITGSRSRTKKQKSAGRMKFSPKNIILTGLFFSFSAAVIYFFVFWPGWGIEQIDVAVADDAYVTQQQIRDYTQELLQKQYLGMIAQNNIIIVPLKAIKQQLLEKFPQLATIEIKRKINPIIWDKTASNIIEITALERQSVAIWCQVEKIMPELEPLEDIELPEEVLEEPAQENSLAEIEQPQEETIVKDCYYIDNQGVIFRTAPMVEGGLITSIYDLRKRNMELGKIAVSPDLMAFIDLTLEKLPGLFRQVENSKGLGVKVVEVLSVQELSIETNEGWYIYFNVSRSAESQLRVLEALLFDQIKEARSDLHYIDLRIDNRAYYK